MNKKRIMSVVALLTAVSMTSATVFAAGPVEDFESTSVNARTADQGWHEDSNGWWYLDEYGEYPRDCIRYIHGDKYLFDKNGYMKTGWYYKDIDDYGSGWFYFKNSGEMVKNEWLTISNKEYYFSYDGQMTTDSVEGLYYLDENGIKDTTPGWKNKRYYVNYDGRADNSGWTEIDGKTYFFDPRSHFLEFNRIVEGYFVDKTGARDTTSGWKYSSHNWYYINNNGNPVTGWQEIDGKTYYFSENNYCMITFNMDGYYLRDDGALDMTPGWKYSNDLGRWFYVEQNGMLADGWKNIGGADYYFYPEMAANQVVDKKYYINQDGIWSTTPGWKTYKQYIEMNSDAFEYGWYYVGNDGYAVQNGWKNIDGAYYYFNDARIEKNVVIEGCYLNKNGVWDTKKGWKHYKNSIEDIWYYVDQSGKALNDGWEKVDGEYYYFDDGNYSMYNGEMLKHMVVDDYYINKSGILDTSEGWKYDGYNWYYVGDKETVYKDGWKVINGKYYHFGYGGALDTDTVIGDCYVDDDGIWRQ